MFEMTVGESSGAGRRRTNEAEEWAAPSSTFVQLNTGFDPGLLAALCQKQNENLPEKEQMGVGAVTEDGKRLYLVLPGDTAEDVNRQVLDLAGVQFPGADYPPTFLSVPPTATREYVLSVLWECAQKEFTVPDPDKPGEMMQIRLPAVALGGPDRHEVFFALPTDKNAGESIERDKSLKGVQNGAAPWGAAAGGAAAVKDDFGVDPWAHLGGATGAPPQVPAAAVPAAAPAAADAVFSWSEDGAAEHQPDPFDALLDGVTPDTGALGNGFGPPGGHALSEAAGDPEFDWVQALKRDGHPDAPTGFPGGHGFSEYVDSGHTGFRGYGDEGAVAVRGEREGPAHPGRRRKIMIGLGVGAGTLAAAAGFMFAGGNGGGSHAQSGSAPTSVTQVLSANSLAPKVGSLPAQIENALIKAENICASNDNPSTANGLLAKVQTAEKQDTCNAGIVQQAIAAVKGNAQATTALEAANSEIQAQNTAATNALSAHDAAAQASQSVAKVVNYWKVANSWVAYAIAHPKDATAKNNANAAWTAIHGFAVQANTAAAKAGVAAPFSDKALHGSLGDMLANAKSAQTSLQTAANGPLQDALKQAAAVG
jgi:hypothetical protein